MKRILSASLAIIPVVILALCALAFSAFVSRPDVSVGAVTGTLYTIQRTPAGWACSCDGYLHTGCCKHLGAVERRAAREGWRFGTVAPLASVARYFPLTPQELIVRGAVLVAVGTTSAPAALSAPTPIAPRISAREARADLFGAAD